MWQDCHSLCVNNTQVVLKQTHQTGLCCLLQCSHSNYLGYFIGLQVSHDFSNESFEWQFLKEEFTCFLILTDLPECYSAQSESSQLRRSLSANLLCLALHTCSHGFWVLFCLVYSVLWALAKKPRGFS